MHSAKIQFQFQLHNTEFTIRVDFCGSFFFIRTFLHYLFSTSIKYFKTYLGVRRQNVFIYFILFRLNASHKNSVLATPRGRCGALQLLHAVFGEPVNSDVDSLTPLPRALLLRLRSWRQVLKETIWRHSKLCSYHNLRRKMRIVDSPPLITSLSL